MVYQAATGKGYERSSNKSSGYGVGVYADSKNSGFTVNANTAKGYGNGETTTNTNSHVTVGGTTYQNIGGHLVLDGAVVTGDHMTGHIDGAILARSRPDTATYTGKQTNAGVSADIGFNGVPQSVSVNAGRSKVNADYAAVKEQTGIAMNSSDVVVAKASRFDGAYFTTATPEDNKTVFKEGVTTTDIQNHMNYKGDAINVGLGAGINPETQKVSPPGISGIGYGKDGDNQTSTTYGAVTGMAGKSDVTTANVSSLNKPLENSFDKTAVETQLGAQVQVSQAFDTERRSYRLEMAREQQKTVEEAKKHPVGSAEYNRLMDEANKQQEKMVLFDSITGAIYGPNTNGVTGYVARAVAPQVSYQIGQYFKGTNGEGTAPHILAHGILAAAVSSATGNDPTTGALSAMGAEAAAPMVANFLFGDKPISELTAEQKATVSSITSLAGLGLGATTGDVASAVNAGEIAKTTTDDNAVQALGAFCGPGAALCVGGISGALYLATPQGQKDVKNAVNYIGKAYESVKKGIYSTVDDYYLDELKGLRSGGDGRLSGDVDDLRDIVNGISDPDKKKEAISILGDSVGARNAEKKRRGGLDKGHQDRLDSETDLLEELKK